jgi:hypothetical protein
MMPAKSFDDVRAICEPPSDWADLIIPMKGGNGPRFSELVDAPVQFVAGDPDAGLWQPAKSNPNGGPKVRKSRARKTAASTEASNESASGGQFWTPIPRLTGSILHAETHVTKERCEQSKTDIAIGCMF